jgi:hypothetical protein
VTSPNVATMTHLRGQPIYVDLSDGLRALYQTMTMTRDPDGAMTYHLSGGVRANGDRMQSVGDLTIRVDADGRLESLSLGAGE